MEAAERERIEAACTRLIHHYANCNDAQDWAAVAELYTEDALFRRPSGGEAVVGRAAILASFLARPPRAQRHVMANVVVDVESPTSARAFSVILLFMGEGAEDGGLPVMAANAPLVGWYRDHLVLTGDGWRFAERVGGLDFRP
jgi:ketosteroid isomerase-like protein